MGTNVFILGTFLTENGGSILSNYYSCLVYNEGIHDLLLTYILGRFKNWQGE